MRHKRIIGIFSALLILFFTFGLDKGNHLIRANENTDTNYLENGDFEEVRAENEPEDWVIYSNQTERPGIVEDAEFVKEGQKAAYIVPASSLTFNLKNLKPNTNYTYSAYVKLSDEKATAQVGAKLFDGDTPQILQEAKGTDYKKYTVSFTTGNQTTAQVFLWSSSGLSGSQKAYLDEVEVVETDNENKNNLVTNPGFEKVINDLRPTKWTVLPEDGHAAGTTSNPDHVYEGTKSGFIQQGGLLQYDLKDLRTNTSYKFSAYVKLNEQDATAQMGAEVDGKDDRITVTGTEYIKQEVIFQTGNQTHASVYFKDDGSLKNGQVAYIDQAMVEEYFDGSVRVVVNVDEMQLAKGDVYPLDTTVIPADASNKNLSYMSDNTNIATVDENGNIHAVGAGIANITVTPEADGESSTSKIIVTENKEPWYPDRENNEWVLTKEDNFEGTELDTDLWSIRGKEYASYHRKDMVSVSDGKLKLKIEREPDGNIVLGRVDTHGEDRQTNDSKFDQKYGFFEVSAKIPPTEETYFAFWLFHYPGVFNVDGTGKEGLEIDIMETVFQGDFTETALHWDGYDEDHQSIGSGKKPAPNIHDGFHTYGMEWSEEYLKFYFDGKLTWEYRDKKNIPWVKEIFILSSGWARSPGWGDGDINNADLPYYSEVDWFRAYQRKDIDEKPDTTEPILYGLNDIELPIDSDIDLLEKVYAVDNKDDRATVTKNITLDETELKRDTPGTYWVTYTVHDEAGNEANGKRRVIVTNKRDNNLLSNGEFNQGNLDHWQYQAPDVKVLKDIDIGKYASIQSGGTLEQPFVVKPNTTYDIRFDAKLLEELEAQDLEIGIKLNDGMVQKIELFEWRTYEHSFTTGPDEVEAVFYAHNKGEGSANVDNIHIAESFEPIQSELKALIQAAKALTNLNGEYTAASFASLQVAIEEAELVLDAPKSKEALTKAKDTLQSALAELDPLNTVSILKMLQDYQNELNEKVYHALTIHITSIGQFEKKDDAAKVVKHVKSLKQLIEHYKAEQLIPKDFYRYLMEDADALIKKWQEK